MINNINELSVKFLTQKKKSYSVTRSNKSIQKREKVDACRVGEMVMEDIMLAKIECTYQDVPLLFVMTSNNILVLRPKRAPNAIASAADAI